MKPYRSKRKGKGPPDAAAIWELRRRLRDAFRRYRVDCAQGHPTATELRKDVAEVVRAARNFIKTPSLELADKLLDRLELDWNTQAAVRKWLGVRPLWSRYKRELRNLYAKCALPGKPALCTLIQIARIDPKNLAPEPGSWRDPVLFRLVFVLAPLWEEVTGRTAAQSKDRIEQSKEFPFAEWLEDMHRLIGFEPPPRGRVLDIVLFQKNPASVRGEKI
jgi:hypothetical protein